MNDPSPLLVVHGIGNRDRNAFSKTVASVGRSLGPRWQTFDFFWGDLGGVSEGLADALPTILPPSVKSDASLTRELSHVRAELMAGGQRPAAAQVIRSVVLGPTELTQTSVQTREAPGERALRERTGQAIEDAVGSSRYLRWLDDPDSLQAIGEVVAEAIAQPEDDDAGATAVRSHVQRERAEGIYDRVVRVIGVVDTLVGRLTSGVGGTMNQLVRRALAQPIALTLGDIVGYQQSRPRILERLFAYVDEHITGHGIQGKPISVMAHSLGGLLVLDAALGAHAGRKLWIDQWVTFGSQPAFFHIMTPRIDLPPYQPGRRSRLPDNIRTWRNLWHPLDPLAFVVAPVFELSDGSIPEDCVVHTRASTIADNAGWMHSAYWESPELIRAMMPARPQP